MNPQQQTAEPEDGQALEEAGVAMIDVSEAHLSVLDVGAAGGTVAGKTLGRSRPGYLSPRGSEGTRGLRDTARRRRDAEEKLQQHLLEAKTHVPNTRHERSRPGQS